MSARTASILSRTEPETKEKADKLFASLGTTTSGAINIFLHKAIEEGGFPFEIKRKRGPKIPYEDELTKEELKQMLDMADKEIEDGGGRAVEEVFDELERKYSKKLQN